MMKGWCLFLVGVGVVMGLAGCGPTAVRFSRPYMEKPLRVLVFTYVTNDLNLFERDQRGGLIGMAAMAMEQSAILDRHGSNIHETFAAANRIFDEAFMPRLREGFPNFTFIVAGTNDHATYGKHPRPETAKSLAAQYQANAVLILGVDFRLVRTFPPFQLLPKHEFYFAGQVGGAFYDVSAERPFVIWREALRKEERVTAAQNYTTDGFFWAGLPPIMATNATQRLVDGFPSFMVRVEAEANGVQR